MGWVEQLNNDPKLSGKVDWARVEEAHKNWNHQQQGLTPRGRGRRDAGGGVLHGRGSVRGRHGSGQLRCNRGRRRRCAVRWWCVPYPAPGATMLRSRGRRGHRRPHGPDGSSGSGADQQPRRHRRGAERSGIGIQRQEPADGRRYGWRVGWVVDTHDAQNTKNWYYMPGEGVALSGVGAERPSMLTECRAAQISALARTT